MYSRETQQLDWVDILPIHMQKKEPKKKWVEDIGNRVVNLERNEDEDGDQRVTLIKVRMEKSWIKKWSCGQKSKILEMVEFERGRRKEDLTNRGMWTLVVRATKKGVTQPEDTGDCWLTSQKDEMCMKEWCEL